jgi:hypothetical protein
MNLRPFLIRSYPARWRARYGDEFEAILEERPLGPFDVADILLGALDAQLRLRRVGADIHQGRGISMTLRIGGFAAIIGPALWAVALIVEGTVAPGTGPVFLIAGLVAMLVAMTGLTAFQARTNPRLTWTAFAVAAIGTVASVGGYLAIDLFGESAWGVWILGLITAFVGSGVFAVVTYRTAVLSRRAAALLGLGCVLPFAAMAFQPLIVVALVCFALGWFALGVQAIRLDRPATAPGSV